eukprot:CAMPEP_0178940810 /NCGR_PEP_ID=MMETSP0789-20121207/1029_1 /TAXON_ID=3005 /ORGANISM="Rhizosolenia setigera, Strain CCMP 1694" /LENGTH=244 /DNA_ID=CAMNT_0020619917 /DNA_START=287 /DNA_END=1021 /DNA_ORIENTATION=-
MIIQKLFDENPDTLTNIEENGYAIVNSGPLVSRLSQEKMSTYLKAKSGQKKEVRTDTVGFLERKDCEQIGLLHHYDLMLGLASYLNENLQFQYSPHNPILPATVDNQLTIPKTLQLAEYGNGDFYKAHSDNSIHNANTGQRRNFRCYTCILYCNDEWKYTDGGALRLYLDSQEYLSPDVAKEQCEFIDVLPHNGRLLIFDSKLVHSVEKTLVENKRRRALTLWTLRPDDSGVVGEVYDIGGELV